MRMKCSYIILYLWVRVTSNRFYQDVPTPLMETPSVELRVSGSFLTDAPLTDTRCRNDFQKHPSDVTSPTAFHNR